MLNVGKVPPKLLEEVILSRLTRRCPEVLVRSGTGQDSIVLDTGNKPVIMSTDPVTGDVANIGYLAIHVATNDIAANGAEPLGVLLTILMPPGSTEEDLRAIMDGAFQATEELNMDILGGHTEVTTAVNRTVLSVTAFGKPFTEDLIISAAACPGLDIVLTKGVGIEGTAILAHVREEELSVSMTSEELERAKALEKEISVVPEGRIAALNGAEAMHDITEGGLLGALYEMSLAANAGFEVDAAKTPLLRETELICKHFDLDPYRLISSGSMLIYTRDGDKMVHELEEAGIKAAVIGRTIEGPNYRFMRDGKSETVHPPDGDELWKVI